MIGSVRNKNSIMFCEWYPGVVQPSPGTACPVAAAAAQTLLTDAILHHNETTNYCILMIMPWETDKGHRRHLT